MGVRPTSTRNSVAPPDGLSIACAQDHPNAIKCPHNLLEPSHALLHACRSVDVLLTCATCLADLQVGAVEDLADALLLRKEMHQIIEKQTTCETNGASAADAQLQARPVWEIRAGGGGEHRGRGWSSN